MSSKQEDFTRTFIWVLAGLVLFTIVVILLARSVGLDENSGPMTDKDIDDRTKPYSTVKVAGVEEAATATPASEPKPAAQASLDAETAPVAEPAAPAPVEKAMESAVETAQAAIDGQALYAACAACHATGAAGAPIVGNADSWAPRIANGVDALVASAISGKGAMPPKGGRMDLDDAKIRAIVEYMVGASR